MPAERLYYDDSYLRTFNARVTARRMWNDHPAVALDRTAFYPESGGQLGDHGALNGVPVLDTQADDDGDVWHMLAAPLGHDAVQGVIDWNRRWDFMQQHHGQHLLSAAFEQQLGARTLSAHLGEAVSTIDLDQPPFTPEQIAAVERATNAMIWANVKIQARFVTPEELRTIPLRKPPKAYERIRVVSAGDFDHSACGGTHPRRTGEVGAVVIRRCEKHKGGTRAEFVCGGRAVRAYAVHRDVIQQLATSLHVGAAELPMAVARLQVAADVQRKALDDAQAKLAVYEARELIQHAEQVEGVPIVVRAFNDRSMDNVRLLARHIAHGGAVALLGARGGHSPGQAQFIFTRAAALPYDMRAALQAATTVVGGRGGGKPDAAQGGGPDVGKLDEALQAARATLHR